MKLAPVAGTVQAAPGGRWRRCARPASARACMRPALSLQSSHLFAHQSEPWHSARAAVEMAQKQPRGLRRAVDVVRHRGGAAVAWITKHTGEGARRGRPHVQPCNAGLWEAQVPCMRSGSRSEAVEHPGSRAAAPQGWHRQGPPPPPPPLHLRHLPVSQATMPNSWLRGCSWRWACL